jgi:hypothetical protein
MIKNNFRVTNNGTIIEASHFPDAGIHVSATVLEIRTTPPSTPGSAAFSNETELRTMMIDSDAEDVATKVELYMRQTLPILVEQESSHFMRATLETAREHLVDTDDELRKQENELLGHALELWGLVEIIDRERHWRILEKRPTENAEPRWIREASDPEESQHNLQGSP